MAKISFKEASKINWQAVDANENGYPGHERVQLGCLMRIADATEAMAKNYNSLLQEIEWKEQKLLKSNRSLKGRITKLKKQLAAAGKSL